MKRNIIFLLFFAAVMILTSCKQEKKVTYYEGIYSEKPVLIYIPPVEDRSARQFEKYPKNVEYNNECNTAAQYFYQTLSYPLLSNGYYVVGPLTAHQIFDLDGISHKNMRRGDIKSLYNDYGIDAVLNTTIHRWVEKNAEWTVYIEYQLRSAKTNTELMHKWVKATKLLPTNLKGDPYILQRDRKFAQQMGGVDNGTAQRCWIVEKCNDYVLRNLPTSSTRRQFEEDLYRGANATYIKYIWNQDGQADVQPLSAEEFEQGCFVD